MNHKILFVVILALFSARSVSANDGATRIGRIEASAPNGSRVTRADSPGLNAATIRLGLGSEVTVAWYPVISGWFSGLPASPQEFLRLMSKPSGFSEFKIVEGPIESSLGGRSGWSFVRQFEFGIPSRGIPVRHFKEAYFVVPRKWGYGVFEFQAAPSVFDEDYPKYEQIVAGASFQREFPLGPLLTFALLLVAFLAVLITLLKRFRRPAQS